MEGGNLRLGEILVVSGYITKTQLEEALAYKNRYGCLIGEAVIRKGFMTSKEWEQFIQASSRVRIGDKLVEAKIITPNQLKHGIMHQKMYGGRLGNILVDLGCVTTAQIEEVISGEGRCKESPRLGEILKSKGYLTTEQLEKALLIQRQSGGRIGDILIFLKYIDENILCQEVASQQGLGRVGEYFEITSARKLSYDMCLHYNVSIVYEAPSRYIVAVRDILNEKSVKALVDYLGKPIEQVLATEAQISYYWMKVYGPEQLEKSIYELYEAEPDNSAYETLTPLQKVFFGALAVLLGLCLLVNYKRTLFVAVIFSQVLYMIVTMLKLYIIFKGSGEDVQLRFSQERIKQIKEETLPIYTLLIPVYKEVEVIGKLISRIEHLDYPQYKLDVCILLEEDDIETRQVVEKMNLPNHYRPIVVPTSQPKTKPKACNYGLIKAKGEYVVIYDAEDRPESDQLKKAYLAFQRLPDQYVCVQSKLNYFNSQQNTLTKWFTQEYSMWFELLLVGIMQLDVPIPLGGTSNHFKIDFLREVGAWDPFNVTEDADLGVRLFKKGYKTAVVDSRTWEEANSKVGNWLRQRSRWIKGYMQTWLVHMRHPIELYRSLGLKGFIGYQAIVLGTPLLPILNPVFWGLLVIWAFTKASWVKELFPGAIYYLATIQLIFGNFMFMYTNMMGSYWVIKDCEKKGKRPFSYGIIKYGLLTPLYWLLMSVAAYKALIQLIVNPSYWEKTNHGLNTEEQEMQEIS